MRWFRRQIAVSCLCGLAITAGAAPSSGSSKVVSPPNDAVAVQQSARAVKKYPLIVRRVVQAGGIRGNLAATRTLDGHLATQVFRLPADMSASDLIDGYRKQLRAAGYQVLFNCRGRACGPHFNQVSPGHRIAPKQFSSSAQTYYLAAAHSASAVDQYVTVQISTGSGHKPALLINRVRVQPMRIAEIRVDAQQMANDIKKNGRVALYGIYFATDSARLRPASKPTLEQIAKLLKNEPKLSLLVVGHTDSQGGFHYNIRLSRQRAGSVVRALVDDYGVKRSRLKAWGDGYSAPRATNRSDAGRARNRRVELVPR